MTPRPFSNKIRFPAPRVGTQEYYLRSKIPNFYFWSHIFTPTKHRIKPKSIHTRDKIESKYATRNRLCAAYPMAQETRRKNDVAELTGDAVDKPAIRQNMVGIGPNRSGDLRVPMKQTLAPPARPSQNLQSRRIHQSPNHHKRDPVIDWSNKNPKKWMTRIRLDLKRARGRIKLRTQSRRGGWESVVEEDEIGNCRGESWIIIWLSEHQFLFFSLFFFGVFLYTMVFFFFPLWVLESNCYLKFVIGLYYKCLLG